MPSEGKTSEPALLVLVSLLNGPKHGYAITDDIERMTGKRLGPGTLYGAISRLERTGLIRADAGDGRRKPYTLTDRGVADVRATLDALHAVAREGRRRLAAYG